MVNVFAAPTTQTRAHSPQVDSQRQSFVSTSAASFQTALSRSVSRNSTHSFNSSTSAHTLGPKSPRVDDIGRVNPLDILSQTVGGPQEVHILKINGDTVEVHHGHSRESLARKSSKSLNRAMSHGNGTYDSTSMIETIGPPPPSPPASVTDHQVANDFILENSRDQPEPTKSEPVASSSRIMINTPPEVSSKSSHIPGRDHHSIHSASSNGTFHETVPPSGALQHKLSLETRGSTHTGSSSQKTTKSIDSDHLTTQASSITSEAQNSENQYASHPVRSAHISVDGYLQPPPSIVHKPARRNTTGSTQTSVSSKPSRSLSQQSPQLPHATDTAREDDVLLGELDSDILEQAHQIRRERLSKRKAQQEAEAVLTRAQDQLKPLVGNLIGEDHVNYILMYNMLTGIRIGVSRCQAKIKRPLTDEDFVARHKFSFDIVGNELTPSAKYDFKFKDYAPWVFRELREDYFGLDPADYLLSLTAQYILSELGSPGKSGSFFYFSRDYRFIIKTIHHTEHKFLLRILKRYHDHVKNNPHTLLSRFYGLHRVKLPRGKKIHFVIMNNLFPPHKDIHETYDLKGSTVGREYPEDMALRNPRATLKDLNWINRGKSLELGPEKRALLTEQLRRDSELLKELYVMDYSLLIGIHNMQRGNRDNVRSNTLKVFSPSVLPVRRKPTLAKGPSPEAVVMRKAMRESDPKRLGVNSLSLPEQDTGDRRLFIFYQDEGGLQATDETNQSMETIYYLGIIDILTPYNSLKRIEHLWKGISADIHKISPVPPAEYGTRFFNFMKAIMRGGEGGQRFKAE